MKRKKETTTLISVRAARQTTHRLLGEIRSLIDSARGQVAQAVNAGLVILYWRIGRQIRQDILKNERAGYGQNILQTLSAKLIPEYGEGFGVRNLARMIKLAEVFPDFPILSTLSTKLGWSHFLEIIYIEDPVKRDFYAEMCRVERWSVRTLRAKIAGMLFERISLSKKPHKIVKKEIGALQRITIWICCFTTVG